SDTPSVLKMDDANKKLENGLEPIYDHVRRPFKRLYLNRAVTQNYLQGHKKTGISRFFISISKSN
ncbi:MAG: hypothetical protein KBT75_04865, partial [Oleispira antarctica]|nr:hypothetical protein [Oleispira antarctica]